MLSLRKSFYLICAGLICFTIFTGCGMMSAKKLEDAETRLKVLIDNGVPDSVLADTKIYLFKTKGSFKSGQSGIARRIGDSLFLSLEKAEAEYQVALEKLKPAVKSMRESFDVKKKELTGLHIKYVDSLVTYIDSFIKMNWIIQANNRCIMLDSMFPNIIADEKHAAKIMPRIVGTWVSQRVPEKGYKGLETRKFIFKKDGTFTGAEQMKGQTSAYVKENWKFLTWGTWKLRGDTAFLFVNREKCPIQVYHNYIKKNGKLQWKMNKAPTYDSTITNGAKDRYLTYTYLMDLFKKKR